MSIATQISRLQTAKATIKTAIENKGVTVPSSTTLTGYGALIDSISTGGVSELSTEAEMDAVLIASNLGQVYRFTGVTAIYTYDDLYEVVASATTAGAYKFEQYTGGTLQLDAPVITLSGTTISWSAVSGASGYWIYKDGAYDSTITTTSYTVSTAGSYQVRAIDSSYVDSVLSNSVTYVLTYSVSVSTSHALVNNNTSFSGTIRGDATLTLTLTTNETDYQLPDTLTISGSTVPLNTRTTIANVATFTYTRSSTPTSGQVLIELARGNITFTVTGQQAPPSQGDLIIIDSNTYRVLSVSGYNVKVLGMFDLTEQKFDTDGSQVYAGSDLDTALNETWYDAQTNIKNAIQSTNITTSTYTCYYQPNDPSESPYTYQFQYNGDANDYDNANRDSTTGSIARLVYALDLADIYDYFNATCITSAQLNTLFFNDSTLSGTNDIWLRSASGNNSVHAWFVDRSLGRLSYGNVAYTNVPRVAFTIDLSQVAWSYATTT